MSQPEFSSPDSQFANDLSRGADDWKPTPHGETLARALTTHDLVSDKEVLELGGGIGNHTIIMARRRPRRLVTTEIAERLIATTRANVERHVPEARSIMEYRVADWLQTQGQFDVVITNPPFARSGQRNRRYFIDSLILDGHRRLKPGGQLMILDLAAHKFHQARELFGDRWLGFAESELHCWLESAGFGTIDISVVSCEEEEPHFETLLASGMRPA